MRGKMSNERNRRIFIRRDTETSLRGVKLLAIFITVNIVCLYRNSRVSSLSPSDRIHRP